MKKVLMLPMLLAFVAGCLTAPLSSYLRVPEWIVLGSSIVVVCICACLHIYAPGQISVQKQENHELKSEFRERTGAYHTRRVGHEIPSWFWLIYFAGTTFMGWWAYTTHGIVMSMRPELARFIDPVLIMIVLAISAMAVINVIHGFRVLRVKKKVHAGLSGGLHISFRRKKMVLTHRKCEQISHTGLFFMMFAFTLMGALRMLTSPDAPGHMATQVVPGAFLVLGGFLIFFGKMHSAVDEVLVISDTPTGKGRRS